MNLECEGNTFFRVISSNTSCIHSKHCAWDIFFKGVIFSVNFSINLTLSSLINPFLFFPRVVKPVDWDNQFEYLLGKPGTLPFFEELNCCSNSKYILEARFLWNLSFVFGRILSQTPYPKKPLKIQTNGGCNSKYSIFQIFIC